MSCRYCMYWNGDSDKRTDTYYANNDMGTCSRFPKEETTRAGYTCGELKTDSPFTLQRLHDQRRKYIELYHMEREDRLKLEKKLKERNRQLKEAKSREKTAL